MITLDPNSEKQDKIKIKGDLLILSEGIYERVIFPNFLNIMEKMLSGAESVEKMPMFRAV
jgi:hypothetical protein